MSKKYFFIALIFFAGPALAHFQTVEIPSNQKPLTVSLQSELFRSQANYTKPNTYEVLPDGHFFTSVLVRPKISYSPLRHLIRFNVFMDNIYASATRPGQASPYVFYPTSVGGGVEFYHKIQTFFMGLNLLGGYPLYKDFVNQNPPQIIVGDGAYFGEVALAFLFQPVDNFQLYNRTAFRFRGSGLSSLGMFNLGGVLDSPYISAGLSVDSFVSIFKLDNYSGQEDFRHGLLVTSNAGSFKFYSVNPSVISFTGWVDFKYNVFKTKLYLNLDSWGKNYAKGLSLGLIAQWTWNTASRKSFLEKKKNRDFGLERVLSPNRQKAPPAESSSYFKEEQDPYLEPSPSKKKPINSELQEELELLNE